MTETTFRIRLAATAIAAAVAISSTPLLAQDAPAPETPIEAPVTPSPDPLAPEPVTDTATEAPAAEASASEAAPAPARSTATRRAAARPTARPAQSSRAAPAASAASVPAAAVAAAPVEAPPVDQTPAPVPAEPVPVEPAASRLALTNEILPIAGAALVGLLALVGAFLLIRRRRRLREIENNEVAYESEADWAEPSREPAFAAAPVAAAGPVHDPVPAAEQAPALSEEFDLSSFSPRVQAAYRGPTPDNPSVSLDYRLMQARAMDEREAKEQAAATEARPAEPPLVQSGGDFMLGRAGTTATVRPTYSKVI